MSHKASCHFYLIFWNICHFMLQFSIYKMVTFGAISNSPYSIQTKVAVYIFGCSYHFLQCKFHHHLIHSPSLVLYFLLLLPLCVSPFSLVTHYKPCGSFIFFSPSPQSSPQPSAKILCLDYCVQLFLVSLPPVSSNLFWTSQTKQFPKIIFFRVSSLFKN